MPDNKLTQQEFNEMVKKGKPSIDVCLFPGCKNQPALTIRENGRDYGICKAHWVMLSASSVEW